MTRPGLLSIITLGSLGALLSVSACVGSIDTGDDGGGGGDDGGGGSSAARLAFENEVFPILQSKCAGCHSGATAVATPFVGATLAAAYTTATGFGSVVGDYTSTGAPILTKVTAVASGHQGQTYLPAESTTITEWLALEVSERNVNPNPNPNPTETPGQVSDRLMREWSGCMKLTDFEAANMAPLWSALPSSSGPCVRCHETGQASFLVSADPTLMFGAISTNRYFMQTFFQADITNLAAAQMIVNANTIDRVARAVAPHTAHPQFDANANGAWDALQEFYTAAMAHKTAGTCDAPRLVP